MQLKKLSISSLLFFLSFTSIIIPKLNQLYQLLIAPIQDLLPAVPEERVIFIPQGSLYFIPFAILKDSSGKYLIEKHTILTSPNK
ncbi:MAG: CHAT domain-containing protein [Desmonostoc geniculatum HA4340-LM1]|jgi:CHAT domain-containing protein|nr:CHAT domain-containing protein [Desmonostoc geniculatum HA4340-LM1]